MSSNGEHAADEQHQPDESSPLLENQSGLREDQTPSTAKPETFPLRALAQVALCISLILILTGGSLLQGIPLNQVLEDNICRNLGVNSSMPQDSDPQCGEDKFVQGELAFVKGWLYTFEIIPGLLTAIPYGVAADRYGRKLIFILCLLGQVFADAFKLTVCLFPDTFPVRLIWASPWITLFGGGGTVFSASLFSILSDLSPDMYRSTTFFSLGAALLVAELVVIPPTAFLMGRDTWLPIWVGFGCWAPAIIIATCLPETLKVKVPRTASSEVLRDTEGYGSSSITKDDLLGRTRKAISNLATASTFLVKANRHISLLLLTLVMTTLGKGSQEILQQFARQRFGWTWAEAGYLVSIKAFIALTMLIVILPAIGYIISTRLFINPVTKDLWMARGSCALMAAGSIVIGLSAVSPVMIVGLTIYSLGVGYNLILRSLISELVEGQHMGVLFNLMGIMESIGQIIAGPVLAASYQLGLQLDGAWIGLPFLSAASLFLLGLGILNVVRLPRPQSE